MLMRKIFKKSEGRGSIDLREEAMDKLAETSERVEELFSELGWGDNYICVQG